MYLSHFQLKQAPFSIAPDPHALFMSRSHREALAHLLYGVDSGGGFVLLTGEIGAGKTTICRCLLEQVPAHCRVAYIFNPKLSVFELLRSICDEFGIGATGAATVKDYVDALNAFLLAEHAAGRHSVLIIDEAQNLAADVLEQLRLLTNLETNTRKLLQVILIGQPELREMVAAPRLEQLAQRVVARYHLGPLGADETAAYLRQRLLAAGGNGISPFTPSAVRLVHRLARGIPRRINLLCDRAMLGAYALATGEIDRAIVRQAAREVFPDDFAPRRRWLALAGLLGLTAALAAGAAAYLHAPADTPLAPQGANTPAKTAPAATPARSVPDAAAFVASLPRDELPGLRALFALWGRNVEQGDPCADAARELLCYRSGGGLAEIRALDRPAVLALVDAQGAHFVLLAGTDGQRLVLRDGATSYAVDALALGPYFQGSFVTAWRAPQGFSAPIGAADSGPAAGWVAARLGLPGAPDGGAAAGQALAHAVRDFQQTQGLKADGYAGPKTLMMLNRATGVDEPRLLDAAHKGG